MNIFNFLKNLFTRTPSTSWVKSPTDFRDLSLGQISMESAFVPESYRIPYNLRVTKQGDNPHCVGYSSATLKEEKEMREQHQIDFDGSWIYNECKKIDGIPNVQGTYFRAGMKILQKKGAMPVAGGDFSKYRIGGYMRVPCDIKSLKRAIYEFGVILVGFYGSNQGWNTDKIRPPRNGERRWGHATVLIGFNKQHIIGQNSWGSSWGDNGKFYFDKNYLPTESWAVVIDLPNNWKDLIGDDENKPKYYFGQDIQIRMKGEEVRILQNSLKWLGCFDPKVPSTGYFGPVTLEAVKVFQRRFSITPVLGFVGPKTRAKLNELFSY